MAIPALPLDMFNLFKKQVFRKQTFYNIIGNYTIYTLKIITLFLQVEGPSLENIFEH